ncbi:MAG: Gfo/Idh/MocA family oxidoreductase [Clostridiales bacterium]|nr:Gfo/Idh/MocA family oxidoreductase [Clostridiales bacterium]
MKDTPITFVTVGSGWRSLFYWRVAQAYPSLFRMEAMLCRTEEKAERMRSLYGIPAVISAAECEEKKPDFIVVAVSKDAIVQTGEEWLERGFPVLLETPAAMEEKDCKRLWQWRKKYGARIQVAEQYFAHPTHAAAIAAVRHGYLGEPYAIDISTVHDYHAASLIRRYLKLGLESVRITAKEYHFPVEETGSRDGAVTDGTVKMRRRVRADFTFTCKDGTGKYAFYDFDGVQYHSRIRGRHVCVRGQRGELFDNVLSYVDENHVPHQLELKTERDPYSGGIRRVRFCENGEKAVSGGIFYENPFVRLGQAVVLPEDETAVGTILLGMSRYLEDGTEVYPLAEALQDAYLWVLMERAIEDGAEVHSEVMPWVG